MSDRPKADLDAAHPDWDAWVERTCDALQLDADTVDIRLVHEVSKHVSHQVTRPLAPVSSYILGIAIGRAIERGETMDAAARQALADRIPLDPID